MRIRGLSHVLVVATLVAVSAIVISAAARIPPAPAPASIQAHPDRTATPGTTIMGFAWTGANEPIAEATVRLRDVLSGAIEALAVTGAGGAFTFLDVEGGTYVVELVDDRDRVVAVGQAFTIGPGQTVATFVRLPVVKARLPGLFANLGTTVVSTAAGLGIVAVAPPAQAASPDR